MRFSLIDDFNRGDHTLLRDSDTCYYLHEYTSGQGYQSGEANNLISNLKKPVDRKGRPEYIHKGRAIKSCSALLKEAINADWLKIGTLIPVPPSKAKTDPLYDDRLLRVCQGIASPDALNIRELVIQTHTIRAAHENRHNRPTVAELEAIYAIDERFCAPPPGAIAIIDDVLTAGTHFRAMHNVLSARFPGVQIVGMFIARRVFPTVDALDDGPF